MVVDKFGRQQPTAGTVRGRSRLALLPLTSDGDVDAGGKRFRYVADPIQADDCVNMRFMLKSIDITKVSTDELSERIKSVSDSLMASIDTTKVSTYELGERIKSVADSLMVSVDTAKVTTDELRKDIKSVADSLTMSIEHSKRLAVDQAIRQITPKYVEYCDKIKIELETGLNEKLNQLNAVLRDIKATARAFYRNE